MWKRVLLLCGLVVPLRAPGAGASQDVTTYWQDGTCAEVALGGNATLSWCVDTLRIPSSGQLELSVSWGVSGLSGGALEKGADTGNEKMYLVDDLGTRYDHIETRGAAADGGVLRSDQARLHGVFVFPPAKMGASEFSFRDDDQHVVIQGITRSDTQRSNRTLSASVLGRVMQTEAIQIDYSWSGLRGRFQEGYTLRSEDGGFRVDTVRDDGATLEAVARLIPGVEIESFLMLLAEAPVLVRDYVPNVTHPDDYPSITVELRTSRDSIVFFSQSQGVGHVPWGIESNGKVFVVPDDTPARALQLLDPFLGRDLAARAKKFLTPVVGGERARAIWAAMEEQLGVEEAYKTAFRLKDLLGGEDDDAVLASLESYLESRRTPAEPEPVPSAILANGDSALVGAAREGDVVSLQALLTRGMDADQRSDLDGQTALIAASLGNHADAVRVLLEAGAQPSVRSRSGETALTLAAARDCVEAVNALIEHGGDIDIDIDIKGRDGKTPLMQAAENGHSRVVVLLLDSGASIDTKSLRGTTALGLAASGRHLTVVRSLLEAGANPNLRDRYAETPLMTTLHPGVARALIGAGADVHAADDQGATATMRLSTVGESRNPDAGGPRRGAGADRLETLKVVLAAGADANLRDRRGKTALIWAVSESETSASQAGLLQALVDAGADVDIRDAEGGTALLHASIHGHIESARVLIEAGADVNVRMGRTTALGFALEHEHAELVRLLLRSGAQR